MPLVVLGLYGGALVDTDDRRKVGELVLGAEANWFGEHWAAVIGGLTCVVVLGVVLAAQRRSLAYDARDPKP
ncbi:hypothetical protein [Microlunatus parietis]|uniref:hypothetical protein n=1 Tax=Microlunatus parietis TaxID=682979 RepID=UPI0015CDFBDC|nr:hypothetical protein [Microlunatus parietis]